MLHVKNLCKSFTGSERVQAVRDVSFTVSEGEMFTLLGPSGCGKTTTLRCIAGLELPTSGQIEAGGVTMYDSQTSRVVPVNRRGLGMVFQSYAIWPHMTVWENVAFPLQVIPRKTRLPRTRIKELVGEALETMGMSALAKRSATQLSGGQQQRLALARAIVGRPKLLLFDEPLSNLDAKLRERMRFEIKRLQSELGLSAVYVTHDQGEALALSDAIAVMRDGEIVQMGTPQEIYSNPTSDFVADFIGSANLIPATATSSPRMGESGEVTAGDGVMLTGVAAVDIHEGDDVFVVVRPEAVALSPAASTSNGSGRFTGEVGASVFLGESTDILLTALGHEFRVRLNSERAPFARGDRVALDIGQRSLVVKRGSLDVEARG